MYNRLEISTSYQDDYFIEVGYDLLDQVGDFLKKHYPGQKLVLIIDEKVQYFHGDRISAVLETVFNDTIRCVIPSGEVSKSSEMFLSCMDEILSSGVERKTPVLAIGGGVTGDLAGFVAASALRGLPLIHVPTTLLAMVDSSIGGKTGINHSAGKNLIGAFYQPQAVFSDLRFLETLPEKEWVNGLSEIIKYGFIDRPELFESLKKLTTPDELAPAREWQEVIHQSATIKCSVVSRDVKEAGIREYLNFGHTYAHVIERVGGYERGSHGEAVYMGMWGAVKVSKELGAEIDISNLQAFRSLYTPEPLSADPKELTDLMRYDKKVKDGQLRLVLLNSEGNPFTKIMESEDLVNDSWTYIMEEFS